MFNLSKLRLRLFVLLVLFGFVIVWVVVLVYQIPTNQPTQYLRVYFLNVGQGDAIFVETPDQVQVLIDGGPDSSILRELSAVMGPFDKTIDLVIATHNDKDHIGGLTDVLPRYQVSAIMRTNNQHQSSVVESLKAQVAKEEAVWLEPTAGQRYILGASTTLTILSPTGDVSNYESNNSSIVLKIDYGETSFLLTGDAPIGIEEYLVQAYASYLPSDVLKLGHHGSRTSSSLTFLTTVAPVYSVVSAGKNNSYGHPHNEVITNVKMINSNLLSTADLGRVTFVSDGRQVWFQTK